MAKILGMNCPHCHNRAQVRTSVELSPTMRLVYFLCTNLVCGHSWAATLEAQRTIAPSGVPNPNIDLPIMEREQIAALDDMLRNPNQRSLFDEPETDL